MLPLEETPGEGPGVLEEEGVRAAVDLQPVPYRPSLKERLEGLLGEWTTCLACDRTPDGLGLLVTERSAPRSRPSSPPGLSLVQTPSGPTTGSVVFRALRDVWFVMDVVVVVVDVCGWTSLLGVRCLFVSVVLTAIMLCCGVVIVVVVPLPKEEKVNRMEQQIQF